MVIHIYIIQDDLLTMLLFSVRIWVEEAKFRQQEYSQADTAIANIL